MVSITWRGVFSIFYIVIIATLFCGSIQTYLIKRYSPTEVAPYSLLMPFAGLISGWIIFDESIKFECAIASAFVFLGLAVNQWPDRKKRNIPNNSAIYKSLKKLQEAA
jgi:O-acetylserine/cysteine efflux transporter